MKTSESYKQIWAFEIAFWVISILIAALAGAAMARVEQITQHRNHSSIFPRESLSSSKGRDESSVSIEGAARARAQATYGRLPLTFEPNNGQAPREVEFLSSSPDAIVLLTANDAVIRRPVVESRQTGRNISLQIRKSPGPTVKYSDLRLHLVGSNPAPAAYGNLLLTSKSNYLTGGDPQKWKTGLPNYSKVRFEKVYPGIDLVYYGNHQELEYDFVIQPGSNPQDIRIEFSGNDGKFRHPLISRDTSGDLLLQTELGEIRQPKPVAYQDRDDNRRYVPCDYSVTPDGQVKFDVGPYDPALPVVIDPVLSYSVVGIGGSAIAVDSQGNAYVTGIANPAFVTSSGAFQASPGGGTCYNGPNVVPCPDILVAKLNPSGTELIYSTFLGGSGADYSYGIAVDSAGNTYVTGSTNSQNFPTTPTAFQPQHSGEICGQAQLSIPCNNAFVTKLNPDGTKLVYSTYLHGSAGGRVGNGIAINTAGEPFVTGEQENDSFVTKLDRNGETPAYSITGIGGSSIAIDNNGNGYVTGRKGNDSYVTKFSTNSNKVIYSFRLGGTFIPYGAPPEEVEALTGISVDSTGSAYVTGYTAYQDFPTTPGAAFPAAPGAGPCGNSLCRDAFVSKLNPAGTALLYSTYLGGKSVDYANGIVVDISGNAYVTGVTRSNDFPVTSTPAPETAGGVFVSKLNAAGTRLEYSITLGDINSSDSANSIAVDSAGNAYVTGNARSFSPSSGAYTPSNGLNDSFVAKIFDKLTLFVPVVISASGLNDSFFTTELTLSNRSHQKVTLGYAYTAAFGGGSGSATDTLEAGQQRIIPDAIAYLKSLGMPLPESGSKVGTLAVRFDGLASADEGAVTARTTTVVSDGRVGLAYAGIPAGFTGPVYLCGLRHNAADRTNVAIQNTGNPTDEEIVLRLTVYPSNPRIHTPYVLPEETLAPGGFKQLTGILKSGGLDLDSGFVRVERVRGNSPFYAYAVINDQVSSDGSFVPPVEESQMAGRNGMTLPVVVETATFTTEVNLTNFSSTDKILKLSYSPDGLFPPGTTANLIITLKAKVQMIIPNFVQWMRENGVLLLWPNKQSYVGPLFVTTEKSDAGGVFVGGRTSTAGGGGQYGVFYASVPYGAATANETWIYGLQQNAENRSSLGIVNTGELSQESSQFQIEIHDGESGTRVTTVDNVSVESKKLLQTNLILGKYAPQIKQGYLHIRKIKGANPFIAYSVINDGGQPGERTGDGAFITSSP